MIIEMKEAAVAAIMREIIAEPAATDRLQEETTAAMIKAAVMPAVEMIVEEEMIAAEMEAREASAETAPEMIGLRRADSVKNVRSWIRWRQSHQEGMNLPARKNTRRKKISLKSWREDLWKNRLGKSIISQSHR